mmetsp:Transcript_19272/g.53459  ORF Transcript_19272/g.53459 Transcript_19272/m.53459 type:complete len:348 (-) Transcript_19272:72-1115(-)
MSNKPKLRLGGDKWWEVRYANSPGIDAGGLFRDSISRLAEELCSPRQNLFVAIVESGGESADRQAGETWAPNPECTDWPRFEFLGHIMAACVRSWSAEEGGVSGSSSPEALAVTLAGLVWRRLVGRPVTWGDYAAMDPAKAARYEEVERNQFAVAPEGLSAEQFEDMGLTFEGLQPGGEYRPVTLENRVEFVRLSRLSLVHSMDRQIDALRTGMVEGGVPVQALGLMTPEELEIRVAGAPLIDLDTMKRDTTVSGSTGQQEIFWESVQGMSMSQRSLLLRFATGRSRLPARVRVELESTVNSEPGYRPLPTAATCGFTIRVPTYPDTVSMREALVFAVENCGTFEKG